jgi:integrase
MRRQREKNPKRPVATIERFRATRAAMQELAAESTEGSVQSRWMKMELALVLAEATGRRLGSIRQLRWEDVDLARGQIRWRAEADKKRKEWVVPIPSVLVEEIRGFQRKLGAVGGWVFAAEKDSSKPMDRHLFDKWLTVAEKRAKLEKLDGGLWHAYRRKWATERKHLPVMDVAAAGGWNDVDTLLKVYQQPDPQTLLVVMSEPRKVSELVSSAQ